ncbi:uncharacterized protein LOC117425562 [Acipenser ruthenus]|uniref:uncharacterized protein LOC117425562 n=1 Tax=Acipenser ruthenus TaxID=7906 RepID=UPI00145B0F9A|nr:uncharacterized protein LOC117425562 [Acipenser ruthenus]XP_058875757.1 uncharacterized protein LOC117425562 [Acipenser ruthenus]
MAEIEDIFEGVEEAIDGADDDIEDLSEEAQEEIKAEVAEARAEVAELSKVSETLKTLLQYVTTSIPKIVGFVVKNLAIGAILWGVNVVLNKLLPDKQQSKDVQRKRAVIKALTAIIKNETGLSEKLLKWMTDHKDDMIQLEGFEVPMESIIQKYIGPVSDAVEQAFKVANSLTKKIDGKTQINIPTAEDIQQFLAAADAFLQAFSNLIQFVSTHVQQIKELKTFPLTQADIDSLKTQLDDAKALPLW